MIAFDVAPSGRMAVVRGRKLSLEGAGPPVEVDLGLDPLRCRFRGEDLVVLGSRSELVSLTADGTKRGEARVREDARDIAALPGGGVLVSYGRRGGVTVERFGEAYGVYKDPALLDATCLAAESGGAWVLGTAAAQPTSRAVRLRPVAGGYVAKDVVALPAPPRAATVGPDGALYVLLEPGESLVRVDGGRAGEPVLLPAPLHGLARQGRRLLGCGAKGVEDLSGLVPPPPAARKSPKPPPCSP